MTLLVTVFAAFVSTIVWYTNEKRNEYRLGTLALMYWGASIMWFVDFVAEYSEMHAEYFEEAFSMAGLNDALLGVSVVVLGLVAWMVIVLIKDPKGVFKSKFSK